MPNTQMKFYADIQNFDNLARQEKSFINFIMKHGALFISGKYDENTHELQHISGAIRLRAQSINTFNVDNSHVNRHNGYDVFIPYIDQWVDDIDLNDGIPDVSTHLNNIVNTYIKIFKTYDGLNGESIWGRNYRVKDTQLLSSTATITPKIGGTVNTDSRYMPVSLPFRNEYPEVCTVPIDLTNTNYEYDFQLRTPTFTVKYDLNVDVDESEEYAVPTGEYNVYSDWFCPFTPVTEVDDQYRFGIPLDDIDTSSDLYQTIMSGGTVSMYIDSSTSELVISLVFQNGCHGEYRLYGNTDEQTQGTYYTYYDGSISVEVIDSNNSSLGTLELRVFGNWDPAHSGDLTIFADEFQQVQNVGFSAHAKCIKQVDLFYKIGVFNVDQNRISTSDIVSQLVGKEFNIFNQGSSGYDIMVYRIKGDSSILGTCLCDDGYISDGNYTRNMCGTMVRKSFEIPRGHDSSDTGGNVEGLPNTMMLPLGYMRQSDQTLEAYDNFDLVGFLYFELYDSENKPFTDELNGCVFYNDWELYKNNGHSLTRFYISNGYGITKMPLTNEHVQDGAFIEWVQQDE